MHYSFYISRIVRKSLDCVVSVGCIDAGEASQMEHFQIPTLHPY